jgi:protease I
MPLLSNKRVAILTENGFEESELTSPKEALEKAGAIVEIVSPQKKSVKGWKDGNWSITLDVNVSVSEADASDYDALVIPGGVINPDLMRRSQECIDFAKSFLQTGKPVAAICHGPQLLIETGLLNGRHMTSYPSVKTDLINAGVNWEDKEVIVDHGLVTSRSPEDLPAFNKKLLEEINLSGIKQDSAIVANARHVEALQKTNESLQSVLEGLNKKLSGDLLAPDIRNALYHLGLITGEVTTDMLLANIFGKFCIGK